MSLSHLSLIASSMLAGAALVASTVPAAAACSDLDVVVATFVSHGATIYMIPPERLALVAHDAEDLTGGHYAGVTRGFLVKGTQGLVLGFEIGGCLIDPIRLPPAPQYTAEMSSA